MASVKRGEVFLVNFDPTVGAEAKKTRPAVVVSNDVNNTHSPSVWGHPRMGTLGQREIKRDIKLGTGSGEE
jgi:mRNA-degrading endonuclease toxin of MazEF toxin-antitoxin module